MILQWSSVQGDVRIVKRERVGQLRVNSKHAGRSDCTLIGEITVHECSQVETAKVPNDIENVVDATAYQVIGAKDYVEKLKNELDGFN